MIYLYYAFLVPLSLVVTLLGLILSPILPLFASEQNGWLANHSVFDLGPRLPTWLSVFMTPDNSLDGDSTFEQNNGKSYWSKVKWLCRNPAYSFGMKYVYAPYDTIVTGDSSIKDNDNAKAGICFVRSNGLFQFRYIKQIPFTARCILINLGWNIMVLADKNVPDKQAAYQATFVFSPRISGFR
jgi:hypothetical protein